LKRTKTDDSTDHYSVAKERAISQSLSPSQDVCCRGKRLLLTTVLFISGVHIHIELCHRK